MAHVSKKTSLAITSLSQKARFPKENSYIPSLDWVTVAYTYFKVFDTLGNSSEVTIAFEVKENSETYTISLEEEPATERATISCQDQNGNDVTESKHTRISVTNTLGEEIWSYETTENNPFPLTWNLQDNNGKRVSAGQYYCKGYFETSAGTIVTPAKKIVVITQ